MEMTFCGLTFKNPIFTASGTFSAASGRFYDYSKLGAVTTKGVSAEPWPGNPTPRIAETPNGMLNAVGLENSGAEAFIKTELPFLRKNQERIIANIAGRTLEDYVKVAQIMDKADVDMLELNISCPNIKEGGQAFGTCPKQAFAVTEAVKKAVTKPLIVKLTPNVTDITEIARSTEAAGADALSLINTIAAMRIDLKSHSPILANKMGGLSGPAVLPVAIGMVYRVARAVKLPIIGMGGISTGRDAAEFLLAGATAVAVGTAALTEPGAPLRILEELASLHKCGTL